MQRELFTQAPVRMGPEEAFAQGDKYRDVEDRFGGQMMQLNPANKEKSTEKLVDGGGKAANEVVDESYPKSNRRAREAFVATEDQRVFLLHQAQLLEGFLVLVGDFRSLPSRDLHLLHRRVGPRSDVLGQLRARRHGIEFWSRKKIIGGTSTQSLEMAMAEVEREER
jgi:hypothetical protein